MRLLDIAKLDHLTLFKWIFFKYFLALAGLLGLSLFLPVSGAAPTPRGVCLADSGTYCAGMAEPRDIYSCLVATLPALESPCRSYVQGLRGQLRSYASQYRRHCGPDERRLCVPYRTDPQALYSCMQTNSEALSTACRDVRRSLERFWSDTEPAFFGPLDMRE
ncbi:MAG: hypothetical protein H7A21_02510 [Spirochaetales bacterium]|nr:hypothetical protein [Leptospiraceae bacterium]MCP5480281.1 hypothetical protein [Spirochaetales bacterium]MCP5486820.1 hypothetical protein [Spirochaetales bacterium]